MYQSVSSHMWLCWTLDTSAELGWANLSSAVVPCDLWGSVGQISGDTNIVSLALEYLVMSAQLVRPTDI